MAKSEFSKKNYTSTCPDTPQGCVDMEEDSCQRDAAQSGLPESDAKIVRNYFDQSGLPEL